MIEDKPVIEAIREITVGDVARFLESVASILTNWILVWIGLALLVALVAWVRRNLSIRDFRRRRRP